MSGPEPSPGRARILVVEDTPSSRELLCDWLAMEGYEVVTAVDLQEGLVALEREPPHAVLLDIKLGDESGLDLARWMRQQPALQRIPVIATTAHAMVTEQEQILQSGCNAYLAKPLDLEVLRRTLRRWLNHAAEIRTGRDSADFGKGG